MNISDEILQFKNILEIVQEIFVNIHHQQQKHIIIEGQNNEALSSSDKNR